MREIKWVKGRFRIAVNRRAPGVTEEENGMRDGLKCDIWTIHQTIANYSLSLATCGLQVGSYKRLKTAKQVAAQLSALPVDWTRPCPLHDLPNTVQTEARRIALSTY